MIESILKNESPMASGSAHRSGVCLLDRIQNRRVAPCVLMKIAFVGDLQTHAWSAFGSVTPDGLNERLMDTIHALQRVRSKMKIERMKHLFILGDIFQARGTLDVVVIGALIREFTAYRKDGIEVYLLLGNHDRVPVGDFHSLESFNRLCHVIDQPALITATTGKLTIAESVTVAAIPYIPKYETLRDSVKQLGTHADVLIGHFAIRGSKLPNSSKTWQEGLTLGEIPQRPMVFLGHDHRHKFFRKKKVCVAGSLLQVDRGDTGIDKFWFTFDTRTKTVHRYRSEGPEFIRLVQRTPTVDRNVRHLVNGNFVDVELHTEVSDLGSIRQQYMDLGARAVEVELAAVDKEALHHAPTRARVDKTITQYVSRTSVALKKKPLIKIGLQIYEEAMKS
jgi:hypothetical protein